MTDLLAFWIVAAGWGQLSILIASAMVPFQMDWRRELASLSRLHRQMYWVYGGYVVLSIIAFALISLCHLAELAAGSGLARAFCGYVAVFWGVRIGLQAIFDVKDHLTTWWLRAGYHMLSVLFIFLTAIYGWAALHSIQ